MEREKGKKGKGEKGKKKQAKFERIFAIFLLLVFASFGFSCKPNSGILNSQKNSQSSSANQPNKALNSFERDLETMRTADFDFIFVMRRKDGGKLDGDDKTYIKMNSPASTNRFIVSDAEKAAIAGSKFKFAPENIMALRDRFVVEDFSKPAAADAPMNANINSNS